MRVTSEGDAIDYEGKLRHFAKICGEASYELKFCTELIEWLKENTKNYKE